MPAPRRAPARRPLIALPRRHPLVLLTEMWVGFVEVIGEQNLSVGALAVGAPDALAGLDVIGRHGPADAELTAAHANDDLVLHHVRRAGHRRADLRVGVLGLPRLFAGLGVEGDQGAVELVQEDLAVCVRQATVDVVTARDRLNARVLLREVLPLDLAHIRTLQVERIDVVRKRGVNVHRVADHEGRSLVTTERAGRERPRWSQVLDVVSGDLVEGAEAGGRVVLAGHHPLLVIGLQLDQLLVRIGAPGDRKSTRLNSSHSQISYAVFCLKKKKQYHDYMIVDDKYFAPDAYSRHSSRDALRHH